MKLLNETTIRHIFKGDQNLFWDALITDSSMAFYLKKDHNNIEFTPFIHDEKFGAPDQNLIHCLEKPDDHFFISEDYADSAGDATYLNIDTSYGLFYFPVIGESRLKEYSISLKSLSKLFVKLNPFLDDDFLARCARFGLYLDSNNYTDLGLGDNPNREDLNCFFDVHPEQRIYYVFTHALGRFGIAPIKDNNMLMSSVYLSDTNLMDTLQTLFKSYLLKGLFEQSELIERSEIQTRYNNIDSELLSTEKSNGTITDLQKNIILIVLNQLKEPYRFTLTKSSIILTNPELFHISHFYLDNFKKNNELMNSTYNESLNQSKMSIQRIHKGEVFVNLPFYLNIYNDNNRYTRKELFLNFEKQTFYFKDNGEYVQLNPFHTSFISGKAIPFLNEFRMDDKAIALPEQGSKYTPACDAFIVNARKKGLLIPQANTIRISICFLDNLKLAKNKYLILPKVLVPFFGNQITCLELSQNWRKVVKEISNLLNKMKLEIKDGREVFVANTLLTQISKKQSTNDTIAKFMDKEMLSLLLDQAEIYKNILQERVNKKEDRSINLRFRTVSFQIKIMVRFYMKQLIQIHDGLLYLNDRPYSLAVYLMFGQEFLEDLIKNVTFRLESV